MFTVISKKLKALVTKLLQPANFENELYHSSLKIIKIQDNPCLCFKRLLLPKSMFQETRENLQVLLIKELGTKFVLINKNAKWPLETMCFLHSHFMYAFNYP